MLKKSLLLSLIAFGLAGCSSTPNYELYAKYKISDNDMKQVIAQYKPILYCIHPEAVGKSHDDTYNLVYRKWSEAESRVWNNAILHQIYVNTIGQRDTDLIYKDNNSLLYRNQKWLNLWEKVQPANNDYLKCGQKDKKEFQATLIKPIEQHLAQQKKEEAKQKKIAQAKAEKARKEQEAFYKTPQGRIVKAQEEVAAAQRAAAQAQQQAAYAQQAAAEAAAMEAKRAEWSRMQQQSRDIIRNSTPRYTSCYGNAYGNSAYCYSF